MGISTVRKDVIVAPAWVGRVILLRKGKEDWWGSRRKLGRTYSGEA